MLSEGETKSLTFEREDLKLLAASTNDGCCCRGSDDGIVTAVMQSPPGFCRSSHCALKQRLVKDFSLSLKNVLDFFIAVPYPCNGYSKSSFMRKHKGLGPKTPSGRKKAVLEDLEEKFS